MSASTISSSTAISAPIPTAQSLAGGAGPPPDLSARFKLKAKYARLQRKYAHVLIVRKDLMVEVEEKEEKLQRLQDEVNLVIDQIYDSDYAHLAPEHDDLFSDVEEGGEEGDQDDDEEEVLSRDEYQESTHYAPEDMINGNGRTRKHTSPDNTPARKIKRPRLDEAEATNGDAH